MDINLIRNFVEIVDARSLSAAARKRDITRSKVSKELKALETALGVTLLHRTTRSFLLTAAGEVLYEHGRSIIQEVEAAQGAIDALQQVVTGSVRLSIPTGLGELYLADMLLAFQKRHPQVRIRVLFSNRVTDPMSAQVDVAVRVARDVQEHLVARDLGPVGFGLYASSAYAKARPFHDPAEIPHGVLLTPPGDGKTYAVSVKKGQQEIALKCEPCITSEHFPFLKQSMLRGSGVATLPNYMVMDELRSGAVQRVCPDWTVSGLGDRLYIITAEDRRPSHAVKVMTEFLRASLLRFVEQAGVSGP
ncbi:MAG: LysR family transcriptional regulator [Delftia acidovorans]|jgi:DNA-binding transcriptional LysR family regulator|nr:LysR family transcriptional regulator [Delftia acidovorans]